jgi:CelD/BcsL family acetyltransferase involved in cellulose biosynthesis
MEIIDHPSGLARLAGGWERLAARSGTVPMDDYPWALASANTVSREGLHVVVSGDADEPRAVAPLVRRGGRLELLGTSELYEPADLLAGSEEALHELVEDLGRLRRPLFLGCVPGDSPTLAALRSAAGRRMVTKDGEAAPSIALGEAWTEPGGGLSSRRRSDLRRAMRRAEAEGDVTFELLAPSVDEVPALLEQAYAIEDRSWKHEAGTALARDVRRGAFFRRYAQEAARRGQLRLDFMRIGGKPAAMQLAVEWRERVWLLKIGYDEQFNRTSPGMLLLAHAVSDAARRGLRSYELLGDTQAWVRAWTDDFRPMTAVAVYPLHPRGTVALTSDLVRYARSDAGRAKLRKAAVRPARAAVDVAARRYLAGPALEDALARDARYRERGILTTIGFFDGPDDDARSVLARYEEAVDALAGRPGAQISIKAPSIGNDRAAVQRLLDRGDAGIHLDGLAPDTQTAVLDLACALAPKADGRLGCTLAGRWTRSLDDAARVAEHGLRVRVVKSEWPDPEDAERDPRAGYVAVVRALAEARPPLVAVATQDVHVARRALEILREAEVPSELQVLHGARSKAARAVAGELGVPVRVYVPFGYAWLPHSLVEAARHPAAAVRLGRERVRRTRPL